MDTDDEAKAALTADFPDWHIWRGRDRDCRPSGWYATHRGLPVVSALGPSDLRQQLGRRCGEAAPCVTS